MDVSTFIATIQVTTPDTSLNENEFKVFDTTPSSLSQPGVTGVSPYTDSGYTVTVSSYLQNEWNIFPTYKRTLISRHPPVSLLRLL